MTGTIDQDRRREATTWMVRLRDGHDFDGRQLVDWLEASQENRDAFEQVSLADADADALVPAIDETGVPTADNDDHAPRRRWALPVLGSAIAASFAVLMLKPLAQTDQIISVPAGQQRTLDLDDGSRVVLNGGSELTIPAGDPRSISLIKGQAFFVVRHDEAHPFTVTVGNAVVEDIGTQFEILHEGGSTSVEVAEGIVAYRGLGKAVTMHAGDRLRASPDGVTLSKTEKSSVATWREGVYAFDDEAIGSVLAEVSRSRGYRIDAAPSLAARPFTGTLNLPADEERAVRTIADLIGADAAHKGGRWQLLPKGAAQG